MHGSVFFILIFLFYWNKNANGFIFWLIILQRVGWWRSCCDQADRPSLLPTPTPGPCYKQSRLFYIHQAHQQLSSEAWYPLWRQTRVDARGLSLSAACDTCWSRSDHGGKKKKIATRWALSTWFCELSMSAFQFSNLLSPISTQPCSASLKQPPPPQPPVSWNMLKLPEIGGDAMTKHLGPALQNVWLAELCEREGGVVCSPGALCL